MAWNPVFPLTTTLINQSVNQIQNNWAFIQNSADTDHYFNPLNTNLGHHRFSQMITQAADIAPAAGAIPSAISLYAKVNNAPNVKLWCNTNTGGVRQLQTTITIQTGLLGAGVAVAILNFAGTEQFQNGIVIISNAATRNFVYMAYIIYNGAVSIVPFLNTLAPDIVGPAGATVLITPFVNSSYYVSLMRMEL